jgi:hypothetical protein
MSLENVVQFWQHVAYDNVLHDQIKRLARDKSEWAARVAEIAGSLGLSVSAQEVMETEAVIAFWQEVEVNSTLQLRLKTARELQSEELAADEVVKVASEAGYTFSAKAVQRITKAYADGYARASHDLTERQLDDVVAAAGGASASSNSIGTSLGIRSPRIGNYVWAG